MGVLDPDHTWKRADGTDRRKCPAHNMWMRKDRDGIPTCELCRVERDARQREYEQTGGSNKPPVVIKKV